MDVYNPELAARVWQRVQKESEPTQQDAQWLFQLIVQEWTDATTYLALSRRTQGKFSALLRRMFQEEQTHAACLKGIYTLMTGAHPVARSVPPVQESISATLRRCYGREMQCLAQYEAHSADPEYGQVFSRLAAQEREHCRVVLELLGSLQEGR